MCVCMYACMYVCMYVCMCVKWLQLTSGMAQLEGGVVTESFPLTGLEKIKFSTKLQGKIRDGKPRLETITTLLQLSLLLWQHNLNRICIYKRGIPQVTASGEWRLPCWLQLPRNKELQSLTYRQLSMNPWKVSAWDCWRASGEKWPAATDQRDQSLLVGILNYQLVP